MLLLRKATRVMCGNVFTGSRGSCCCCSQYLSASDRMDMEGEAGSGEQKQQACRRKALGASLVAIGAVVGAAGVYNSLAAPPGR